MQPRSLISAFAILSLEGIMLLYRKLQDFAEVASVAEQTGLCLIHVCRFSRDEAHLYEPRHDKPNKMSVRPAQTQISLGIRPVWSESSLSAWRKLGSLADAQADLSLRWAHSHSWFCHVVAHIFCFLTDFTNKSLPCIETSVSKTAFVNCVTTNSTNEDEPSCEWVLA